MLPILILGAILRILYFVLPRSFWGDEWFTIFLCRQGLKSAVIGSIKDVHPPLQFILFHFGGYRLFPFIAGILSLYFFSKLSKDKLATFIFAISPYFIHLSGETRGYGFLCLFSILALLGYRWAFPLALFTEHYAWFLLLSIPFSLWFIPFLIASGSLIAFQTGTEHVFTPGRSVYGVFPIIKKTVGFFLQLGGGVKYSFLTHEQAYTFLKKSWYLVLFLAPLVFLFYARNKKYFKLLFVPFILLLIFYPVRLSARYMPFSAVAYLLLIGEGFRMMRTKSKIPAYAIMALFITANSFSLAWLLKAGYDPYHREDYIGASEYVKNNIKTTDGLIGCRDQVWFYLKKNYPENGTDIWEVSIGNPDMAVNESHWRGVENKLGKKLKFKKQFGDLVWVARFEPQP